MKTRFQLSVSFLILLIILNCFFSFAIAGEKRIIIGTAGTSGALYPMGVALAEVINEYAVGIKASAEASAASLENIRNLDQGNIEWGISMSEFSYFAYNGLDIYENKKVDSLRSLFGTLLSWTQIFTLADSDINTISDFKGKRIGMGSPGSGGEKQGKKIIEFYGLDYNSIKPVFISDMEMVEALKDGSIDAFISTHPLGSAAFLELTNSIKVKMIPVDAPEFYEKYPYYTMQVIPKGTYKNVDYDVPTVTVRVNMLTSTKAGLTEDDIYQLLKVIWEHEEEWTSVHAAVKKSTTLERALIGLAVPLHPGAVKFYTEKGFSIPKNLLPPEMQ